MFRFNGESFTECKRIHIYEGANQLRYFRYIGAFCAVHTIMWGFITYNRQIIQNANNAFKLRKETMFQDYSWYKSYKKVTDSINANLETEQIDSWLTAVLAFSTLLGGILLPRRMIRNVTLITAQNNKTSTLEKFIEIGTYGGFGIKSSGRTFKRPLKYISFDCKSPYSDVSKVNIHVKYVPIRFLLDLQRVEHIDDNELLSLMYQVNKK
ncbi:unnamed protein product [Schistosoma turkestanicum]|nr:unnamed protein product [Schistosoma turkestanicum]